MCGICAIVRTGPESQQIAPWRMEQLLIDNQKRGIDATGVAVQLMDGRVEVFKEAKPALRFVADSGWEAFKKRILWDKVWSVIGHTRAWTVGEPSDNNNNHPVVAGNTVIVHNGGIYNHDRLFQELKLKRPAEVDSSIIAAILEEEGLTEKGVRVLCRMGGHAAFAALSQKYPGQILFGRSGSPMEIASLEPEGQIVMSSRREGIHLAARNYKKRFNLYWQKTRVNLEFSPVRANLAMLFTRDKNGILDQRWEASFDSAGHQVHNVKYDCHSRYSDKWKGMRHDGNLAVVEGLAEATKSDLTKEVMRVICHMTNCLTVNVIPAGERLGEYECGRCATMLVKGEA